MDWWLLVTSLGVEESKDKSLSIENLVKGDLAIWADDDERLNWSDARGGLEVDEKLMMDVENLNVNVNVRVYVYVCEKLTD